MGQNSEMVGLIGNMSNSNLQQKKKSLSYKRSLVNQKDEMNWTQIPQVIAPHV